MFALFFNGLIFAPSDFHPLENQQVGQHDQRHNQGWQEGVGQASKLVKEGHISLDEQDALNIEEDAQDVDEGEDIPCEEPLEVGVGFGGQEEQGEECGDDVTDACGEVE